MINKQNATKGNCFVVYSVRNTAKWRAIVFALSNKINFEEKVPIKTVCEPCFVDYQSTAIGILRSKGPGEDRFGKEGKFLVSSVSQYLLYLRRSFSKAERL